MENQTSANIHRDMCHNYKRQQNKKKKALHRFFRIKKRCNTFVLNNILITRAKRSFKISIV